MRLPILALVAALVMPAAAYPGDAGAGGKATDDRWSPEVRARLTPDFIDCLARAHAVRPIQQCYGAELTRQRAGLDQTLQGAVDAVRHDQDDWTRATNSRCAPPARQRGSLASQKAQACFLDAVVRRRIALQASPPKP